ncbi:hypothetical protein SLEP1_g32634 [Rubroshorea leprosula]|uniref:Uncharacterized protein n=1 Tax=Rubroshorea leprosula TaxID=152421 RepID=A0AAV5KDZ4_9ROSI|nr:hypothetical protein SLEP1_g32634 [Rubroshorea leprosula]
MACRSATLLLLALLLFYIAQASSDARIEEQDTHMEVVKGPNRRLLPFVGIEHF